MTLTSQALRVPPRTLFLVAMSSLIALMFVPTNAFTAELKQIEVYKSPTCGCCKDWITHLQHNGFKVTAHDTLDMQTVKQQHGVAAQFQSCHTAIIDGYVIEGHVPANDIKRLLREHPMVQGLAVPGMPQGAPGMETGLKQPYNVLTIQGDHSRVYSHY